MLVYVLSKHGKPLMPCTPGKARKLLKSGKAKVVGRIPFTIQLLYGSTGYKQETHLKVDSGSKIIGVAAVNTSGKILYASEVKTRSDIHKKMEARAMYRRSRRGRKLRYRPPRFDNSRRKDGWLTPTMFSKVRSHLKEINFVKLILPVKDLIIETASFDIHKITNPEVNRWTYTKGRQKDFYNTKAYVLARDQHTCQK
ncbi:MAG: RRXRR domain-containing protein, partial [Oligoflexia bacterium]|nr:RRXRR domain-containing protein [Oligoflexia bacterium]